MVKKARDRSRLFPNFIKCGELSREVCVWENGDRITFSIMDFSGVLEICDPEKFLRKLLIGFGKEKAFGCGLMLIRRQVAW